MSWLIRRFGHGSSREQAAAALKFTGAGAVIAASFARIFFRNAINLGLAAVVSPDAAVTSSAGDELEIDLRNWRLHNHNRDRAIPIEPYSPLIGHIIEQGGILELTKARLRDK